MSTGTHVRSNEIYKGAAIIASRSGIGQDARDLSQHVLNFRMPLLNQTAKQYGPCNGLSGTTMALYGIRPKHNSPICIYVLEELTMDRHFHVFSPSEHPDQGYVWVVASLLRVSPSLRLGVGGGPEARAGSLDTGPSGE